MGTGQNLPRAPTSVTSNAPQTTQTSDTRQTSQISDTRQTSQISDTSQTSQISDTSQTSQISDTRQISQNSDTPQTSQTSDAPQASQTSKTSSKSVTPGAAAGIGVGTFIVGALLAAAIVFFIMQKSRSRRHRDKGERGEGYRHRLVPQEKGGSSAGNSGSTSIVERNLPQPAEDGAIGGELSKIRTLIKNHARSYYINTSANSRISATNINQAALETIGQGMSISVSSLAAILSDPSKRLLAIRFCIAWTALSRIEPGCSPEISFLPPELAACMASMPPNKTNDQTHLAFLSKWRTITAYLLQGTYHTGSFLNTDSRLPATSAAFAALDALLRPFADPARDPDERHRKLDDILKRTARFGYLLFEQPGAYQFNWGVAGKEWVVWPALLQVVDDSGKRVERPRVLEEMEVVDGGERT